MCYADLRVVLIILLNLELSSPRTNIYSPQPSLPDVGEVDMAAYRKEFPLMKGVIHHKVSEEVKEGEEERVSSKTEDKIILKDIGGKVKRSSTSDKVIQPEEVMAELKEMKEKSQQGSMSGKKPDTSIHRQKSVLIEKTDGASRNTETEMSSNEEDREVFSHKSIYDENLLPPPPASAQTYMTVPSIMSEVEVIASRPVKHGEAEEQLEEVLAAMARQVGLPFTPVEHLPAPKHHASFLPHFGTGGRNGPTETRNKRKKRGHSLPPIDSNAVKSHNFYDQAQEQLKAVAKEQDKGVYVRKKSMLQKPHAGIAVERSEEEVQDPSGKRVFAHLEKKAEKNRSRVMVKSLVDIPSREYHREMEEVVAVNKSSIRTRRNLGKVSQVRSLDDIPSRQEPRVEGVAVDKSVNRTRRNLGKMCFQLHVEKDIASHVKSDSIKKAAKNQPDAAAYVVGHSESKERKGGTEKTVDTAVERVLFQYPDGSYEDIIQKTQGSDNTNIVDSPVHSRRKRDGGLDVLPMWYLKHFMGLEDTAQRPRALSGRSKRGSDSEVMKSVSLKAWDLYRDLSLINSSTDQDMASTLHKILTDMNITLELTGSEGDQGQNKSVSVKAEANVSQGQRKRRFAKHKDNEIIAVNSHREPEGDFLEFQVGDIDVNDIIRNIDKHHKVGIGLVE